MELLLSELASVLGQKRTRPFSPEVVVVQSLGMERWISMGLCRKFGVWANAEHPFPRALIERLFDAVIGPVEPSRRWSRDSMTLHLAALMEELPAIGPLRRLQGYLEALADVESRLELAAEIADALDQAQIYRPEWFLAWSSRSNDEAPDDFRPTLFRMLEARLGKGHFAARFAEFSAKVATETLRDRELPERISLFGVAALPPAFLRVFDLVSTQIPVHWFLLTASREYVGEELGRKALARGAGEGAHASLATTAAQPLLASYGRMMQDVGRLLESDCNYHEAGNEQFVEPACGRVLNTLQADLCALRKRGHWAEALPLPLLGDDKSLQVHVCHGPRREIEVLREVLVDAFETDPELSPEDVIVLLRDVELYAPMVDAVFSTDRGKSSYIPYTLSDRAIGAGNDLAEAFGKLLSLANRRVTVSDLSALLDHEAVITKFAIEPVEVPKLRAWLDQLGMRWGADADDRLRHGLPSLHEHTLRFGLRRLVLGAAMDSGNPEPFARMVPFDVEGDDAVLAGRFVDYAEAVLHFAEDVTQVRTFEQWQKTLTDISLALFEPSDEQSFQLSELLAAIEELCSAAKAAEFRTEVPARYLAHRLSEHFERTRSARAFLASGVTFCAMLPMRGVPAKVVALVGLDDGCFPRTSRISSFDEISREPRVGDRLLREEDRHLFLESLLAARERLILTYVGRSARDDSVRPPSVVIEELLRAVDESFYVEDPVGDSSFGTQSRSRPSDRLVILHPMHAYSPRYFDGTDPRLVQSRVSCYRASEALLGGVTARPVTQNKTLPVKLFPEIRTAEFERFWAVPAEAFLQMRLLARLERDGEEAKILDPVELDALERYQLMSEQFLALGKPANVSRVRRRFNARGKSPGGALGDLVFDACLERAAALRRVFDKLTRERTERIGDVCVVVGNTTLVGAVGNLYGQRRVDWRPSQVSEKHRLVAWIRHLLLCASGERVESYVLRFASSKGKDVSIERFLPTDKKDAIMHLERMTALFEVGMTAPLPFLPELSFEFAKRVRDGEPRPAALARAIRDYGDPLALGDSDFEKPKVLPEVARLFGNEPPIEDDFPERHGFYGVPCFGEIAEAVFRPCLDALSKLSDEEKSFLLGDEGALAQASAGQP